METTTGKVGFIIPVQSLTSSQEVKMTPADVMAWRNHLPMADLGATAKKVYHAISDCNKVKMGPKERFEILEVVRTPVQFICQSLRKHYINQTGALTKQQLTIAHLAETLQIEMAMGYKLIVEQIEENPSSELKTNVLSTTLQRIIHYSTHIIIRCYQLYSFPPKNIWRELHLVYLYADKNNLLKQNNLLDEYKRIILLAATYPYQWRQNEQDVLYSATETWISAINIKNDLPKGAAPGFLVIGFNEDKPPMPLARGIKFDNNSKALDVNPLLERIQTLLKTIEPNELQARIAHHHEPEYAVATSVLKGLIKEWSSTAARNNERIQRTESVNICFGLIATHYYVNNEQPFQTQQNSDSNDGLSNNINLSLPTMGMGMQDGGFGSELGASKLEQGSSSSEKTGPYQTQACNLVDESPQGYGLVWNTENYPSLQAGEVVGVERELNGQKSWEVCTIRWLQHTSDKDLRLGLECLSKSAKGGAAQLVKDGNPAGYFLRCLILNESSILLPTLPFKPSSQVSVTLNGDTGMEIELSKVTDSTGSYKIFQFVTKSAHAIQATPAPTIETTIEASIPKKEVEKGKESDSFDSIWSNL